MKLLSALGLDLHIFIAQLVNFAILFFVLYKFGYKPLLKFLDDRKDKIEKGVLDAKKAQEKLMEMEEREKETIKEAKKEALAIIEKAKQSADKKRNEILEKAKEEIGQAINQEKAKMQAEKSEVLKEIKRDTADLVMLTLKKILEESVDEKKDRVLVNKILKNLDK